MTQIKASYGAALLFSPGQHNFIPTYSRKRKAPVVSRCTNWYQTSIKVNSEAPDSESLDPPEREKKKPRVVHPLQKAWNWLGVRGVALTGFDEQTWHTIKKTNLYSLRWKHVLPPENRPSFGHTDFPLNADSVTNTNEFHKQEQSIWRAVAFQPIAASPLSMFSMYDYWHGPWKRERDDIKSWEWEGLNVPL